MTKKVRKKNDVVISISISKEQSKKLDKLSENFEGNKSKAIRSLINKI